MCLNRVLDLCNSENDFFFLYLPSGIFSELPRNCKVHNNLFYSLKMSLQYTFCQEQHSILTAYFLCEKCLKKQIKPHCSGTECKRSGSVHVTKEHHETEKYCLAIFLLCGHANVHTEYKLISLYQLEHLAAPSNSFSSCLENIFF